MTTREKKTIYWSVLITLAIVGSIYFFFWEENSDQSLEKKIATPIFFTGFLLTTPGLLVYRILFGKIKGWDIESRIIAFMVFFILGMALLYGLRSYIDLIILNVEFLTDLFTENIGFAQGAIRIVLSLIFARVMFSYVFEGRIFRVDDTD